MCFCVFSQISMVMRDSGSKMLPHLNGPQFLCVYKEIDYLLPSQVLTLFLKMLFLGFHY